MPEAGAQRTLEAVRCSPWLDADPVYVEVLRKTIDAPANHSVS